MLTGRLSSRHVTLGRFWSSILTADGRAASTTTAPETTAWATSPPTWWKSSRGQVTTHITVTSQRACVWVRGCVHVLHVCVCVCVSTAAAVGRAVLASQHHHQPPREGRSFSLTCQSSPWSSRRSAAAVEPAPSSLPLNLCSFCHHS